MCHTSKMSSNKVFLSAKTHNISNILHETKHSEKTMKYRQREIQTDRHTDREKYRQTEIQTDRQTDRHKYRQTDRNLVNLRVLQPHLSVNI